MGANAAAYALGEMPEPVVVPTRGEAMGSRYHARVSLIYAIETELTSEGAVPEDVEVAFLGQRRMSEERLSIADYPLAEKRPEIVRGKRGKGLDEITLDALLEDRVTLEDLRITAAALRQQAEIARAAGRDTLAANFERAAELVDVPQDTIMRIYELLRPGRAQSQERASRGGPGAARATMAPKAWRRSWKRPPRFTSGAACSKSGSEHEGMTWKTAYRSIYYDGAPEPADPDLAKESTALLVIDVQNTYFTRPDRASLSADEQRRYDAWTPSTNGCAKSSSRARANS